MRCEQARACQARSGERGSNTVKILIEFEYDGDVNIHELLCLTVHEQSEPAMRELGRRVHSINEVQRSVRSRITQRSPESK